MFWPSCIASSIEYESGAGMVVKPPKFELELWVIEGPDPDLAVVALAPLF